jgi:hypothetical protein
VVRSGGAAVPCGCGGRSAVCAPAPGCHMYRGKYTYSSSMRTYVFNPLNIHIPLCVCTYAYVYYIPIYSVYGTPVPLSHSFRKLLVFEALSY